MEVLRLGMDHGFSKTRIALLDRDNNILHEDYVSYFNRSGNQPARERHVFRQLCRGLVPYRSHPLALYLACPGDLARKFQATLEQDGFEVRRLEFFNDTVAVYGLTETPGNCFTLVSGSYWCVMYFDRENNARVLPGLWDCFDLCQVSGHHWGGLILELFARYKLAGVNPDFVADVETAIGYGDETVVAAINRVRTARDKSAFFSLARLVPRYRLLPEIELHINEAITKLVDLFRLFRDYVGTTDVRHFYVGGSLWSNDFLLEKLQRALLRDGVAVIRPPGNAAAGAVWFRAHNPSSNLKTW